jgi:hypothetical protein
MLSLKSKGLYISVHLLPGAPGAGPSFHHSTIKTGAEEMKAEKGQILLTCSGQPATLEQLKEMPIPEKTNTYTPLGHYDFVTSVARIAMEMLGVKIESAAYATTQGGCRMFGVMSLKGEGEGNEYVRALALRNSTDKSMVAGVAGGWSVWCCSNLVISGDVLRVLKKHTGALMEKLEEGIITALYRAKSQFRELEADIQEMKAIQMSDHDAWALFGVCMGERMLRSRTIKLVLDDWKNPRHSEFEPRTLWSAYNCVTEHLKILPPGKILQAHSQLHALAMGLPSLEGLRASRAITEAEASISLAAAGTLGTE